VFFVIFVNFAIREHRDFREQGKSAVGAERRRIFKYQGSFFRY